MSRERDFLSMVYMASLMCWLIQFVYVQITVSSWKRRRRFLLEQKKKKQSTNEDMFCFLSFISTYFGRFSFFAVFRRSEPCFYSLLSHWRPSAIDASLLVFLSSETNSCWCRSTFLLELRPPFPRCTFWQAVDIVIFVHRKTRATSASSQAVFVLIYMLFFDNNEIKQTVGTRKIKNQDKQRNGASLVI